MNDFFELIPDQPIKVDPKQRAESIGGKLIVSTNSSFDSQFINLLNQLPNPFTITHDGQQYPDCTPAIIPAGNGVVLAYIGHGRAFALTDTETHMGLLATLTKINAWKINEHQMYTVKRVLLV